MPDKAHLWPSLSQESRDEGGEKRIRSRSGKPCQEKADSQAEKGGIFYIKKEKFKFRAFFLRKHDELEKKVRGSAFCGLVCRNHKGHIDP